MTGNHSAAARGTTCQPFSRLLSYMQPTDIDSTPQKAETTPPSSSTTSDHEVSHKHVLRNL